MIRLIHTQLVSSARAATPFGGAGIIGVSPAMGTRSLDAFAVASTVS